MRTALLTVLLMGSAEAGTTVEVWSRQAGTKADTVFDRSGVRTVDLAKLPAVDEKRLDFQTGVTQSFHGVLLSTLLRDAPGAPNDDVALLHFANGMQVPVALTEVDALQALIALGEFAPLKKKGAAKTDGRPIVFKGHKLVVSSGAHPKVAAGSSFSPWSHVDSLTGVEWVKGDAYWAQFTPQNASDSVKRGAAVFQGACGFCHGVRGVGASEGWDFVKPLPVPKYRSKAALFLHVRYRELDAPERGLMMPAFKEFTQKDADAVHDWVSAINAAPPFIYAPP